MLRQKKKLNIDKSFLKHSTPKKLVVSSAVKRVKRKGKSSVNTKMSTKSVSKLDNICSKYNLDINDFLD